MSLVGSTPHSSQSGPHSSLESRFTALEGLYRQAIAEIADMRAREALKTQFLANISHDLRTPLTAVITHAEILRDGMLGSLNDRQLESVRGIIAGGRQLLEQVGEILTYARGAANQLAVTPSTFRYQDVVAEMARINQPLLAKKQLRLDLHLPPDLPHLFADREKVAHVLGNLIGNAIEFTP